MATLTSESGSPPPRPRRRVRRLLRDGLLVLLVTGGVLGMALARGPNQAKMLYYQYETLRHTAPASAVVYHYDPSLNPSVVEASEHLDDHDHHHEAEHQAQQQRGASEHEDDTCELLPAHIIPPGGAGDPAALDMLNRYLQYPLSDFMQVLFCHALRTPGGVERLVIVSFGPNLRAPAAPGIYEVVLIEPVTFQGTPSTVNRLSIAATDPLLSPVLLPLPGALAGGVAVHGAADFYAGQVDADDPASFTLTYHVGTTTRTMRGTLEASGRKLKLEQMNVH